MLTMYHHALSPFCRKVRIVLAEKKIPFTLREEPVWERRTEFLALNPAGDVPVLVDDEERVFADSSAICEYLEEIQQEPILLPGDACERAEVRRLVAWFDRKFHDEVTRNLVEEKIMKRVIALEQPNSRAIRAGLANIHYHLEYINFLADRRNWLAGEHMSLADIAAAAQLSSVDYLGDVPWDDHEGAKVWYARVKSRPSFRSILADSMPGVPPPKAYADLDF